MLDIGVWEVATVVVVSLFVIGPKQLPQVARSLGKWLGRWRRLIASVQSQAEQALTEDSDANKKSD